MAQIFHSTTKDGIKISSIPTIEWTKINIEAFLKIKHHLPLHFLRVRFRVFKHETEHNPTLYFPFVNSEIDSQEWNRVYGILETFVQAHSHLLI